MLAAPPQPVTVALAIQSDADDAVFDGCDDEQLLYDVRVGMAESSCIGLRFRLSIPKESRIEHAELRLTRTGGTAAEDDSMRVQIYESSNVPAFDDSHMHRPEAHVAGGLWGEFVGGFEIGAEGEVASPDLSVLIEHVLARDDYGENSRIGLILSSERMSGLAVFADSSSRASAAELRISYVPPR